MVQIRNILVIDDDPIFLSVTESVLLTLGNYNVIKASNGQEGIGIIRSATPPIDVIFLDLNMPHFDGIVSLRALSEAKFDGEIIIASGESSSVIEAARKLADLLGLRIVAVVKKPLIPADAVNALKACSGRKGMVEKMKLPEFRHIKDLPKFAPYYQGQICTRTWRMVGVEALLRVQATDGRPISPRDFLNAIKSRQLLAQVAFGMAQKVFADAAWFANKGSAITVSVNLDSEILEYPDAADILIALAKRCSVDPRRLIIELTEAQMPRDPSRLIETLSRLRMAGFGISMDDFGTGGSNYELLRLCPFTEVKLDQTIVRGAIQGISERNFVQMTKSIARELDIDFVAEGIETNEELQLIQSYGVDRLQGYLFGQPSTPKVLFQNDLGKSFERTENRAVGL